MQNNVTYAKWHCTKGSLINAEDNQTRKWKNLTSWKHNLTSWKQNLTSWKNVTFYTLNEASKHAELRECYFS